jgi:HEAT repeat protein
MNGNRRIIIIRLGTIILLPLIFGCPGGMNRQRGAAKLTQQLRDPDPNLRITAANALGSMGASARQALPHLKAALNDPVPSVRAYVARAIWAIDPKTGTVLVRGLLKDLAGDDSLTRRMAIITLGMIGPDAKDATPSLAKLLTAKDAYERVIVASSLNKIDPKNQKNTVPIFRNALKDDIPETRKEAVQALGRLGSKVKDLEPEIANLLQDDDATVREAAAAALMAIGTRKP